MRTVGCALAIVSMACGPESRDPGEWMYDVFSYAAGPGETVPSRSVGKIRFERGGIARTTALNECGEGGGTWETEYQWEYGDDSTIVMEVNSGDIGAKEEWRFSPRAPCSPSGLPQIRKETLLDGEVYQTGSILRGDLCLESFDCNGENDELQCEDCRTVWCDEPPPPCSDD